MPLDTLKLIRAIALFLIAFCLLPTQAKAADAVVPSWQGVWGGTIGKSNVIVCLASNGKSAYRYQRYQTDIPLSLHGGVWEESVNGVVSGIWTLPEAQADTLEGHWQNPNSQSTLPIRLKKIAGADSSAPCESRAYKSGTSGSPSATNVPDAAVNAGNGKRPEYIYVANQGDNTVSAYRINAITGALISIPGSPFKVGRSPSYIAVNPARTFAYVVSTRWDYDKNGNSVNSTISAYRINAATGALVPVAGKSYKVGFGAIFAAINPAASFIYVVNNGGEGMLGTSSISAFRMDAATGALTPVRKKLLAVDVRPLSITVNPAGTFAYVTYQGSDVGASDDGIKVYRINATTGALTENRDGLQALEGPPTSLAMNATGTFLYAVYGGEDTGEKNGLSVYRINSVTGDLSLVKNSVFKTGNVPQTIILNNAGTSAYIASDGSTRSIVSTYHVNASTGELTQVASSKDMGINVNSILFNHAATFAYILSVTNILNATGTVSAFRINAETGAFTPLNGNPYKTLDVPEYISVNPAGTFVYVTNPGQRNIPSHPFNPNIVTGNIAVYRINPVTGSLKHIPTKQLAPESSGLIKFNSDGTFAYQFDEENSAATIYNVNSSTGALTSVAGGPYKVGHVPPINPAGNFSYILYGGGGQDISTDTSTLNGTISVCRINSIIGLWSPVAAGLHPISFTVNPSGTFLYVVNEGTLGYMVGKRDQYFGNSISVYHIDTSTGKLTQIKGSPFATGGLPRHIAINPSGTFAYVANAGGTSAYRINSASGALTQITGSPFKCFDNSFDNYSLYITINPAGTLAFETSENDMISVYNIDIKTGALSSISGPFVAGKNSISFTIVRP